MVVGTADGEYLADKQTQQVYGVDLIREHGFWKILSEDYECWNVGYKMLLQPGFQAVAVYRFGTWTQLVRPALLRWPLRFIYLLGFLFVRNLYGIELNDTVRLGRRFRIAHQNGIVIHRYGTFGDDCLVRQNVTFGVGIRFETEADGRQGPVIGDRVQFSPGAVIIGNIAIGDDVSIGPNCVVSQDVPSNRTLFVASPRVFQREAPQESSN